MKPRKFSTLLLLSKPALPENEVPKNCNSYPNPRRGCKKKKGAISCNMHYNEFQTSGSVRLTHFIPLVHFYSPENIENF